MKILVAVDGAPCSKFAAESLIHRVWQTDTTFKIISVVEPFHPELAGWNSGFVPAAVEAQKERFEESCRLVRETAAQLRASSSISGSEITVEEEVLEGHVKEKIVETARQWGADLIVMGSHGRHGVEKLFLGSISQGVLSDAPCSVEIVKDKTL